VNHSAHDWQAQLVAAGDSMQADLERVWARDSHDWWVGPEAMLRLRRWRVECGLVVFCSEVIGPFMRLEEIVAVRALHRREWTVVGDVATAETRIRARWSEVTGMPWPS
jgi:hypothetical protein